MTYSHFSTLLFSNVEVYFYAKAGDCLVDEPISASLL